MSTEERRLSMDAIRALRASWGKSALLFLTDRCPVGCAHCSVDSLPSSPTITDWNLFEEIVAGLARMSRLEVVGISGGEPFVERRGLERAVATITSMGKRVVLYTSGVWARSAVPQWARSVLEATSAVFLSMDAHHRDRLDTRRFATAASAVLEAGAALIVPVLDDEADVDAARALLREALGENWASHAELMRNPKLPYGRGAGLYSTASPRPARSFGACGLARSPVVRYDGRVTACCNESLITGAGPPQLAAQVATADELAAVFQDFLGAPLLRIVGSSGPCAATRLAGLGALGSRDYHSICDFCWELHRAEPDGAEALARLSGLISSAREAEEEAPCSPR